MQQNIADVLVQHAGFDGSATVALQDNGFLGLFATTSTALSEEPGTSATCESDFQLSLHLWLQGSCPNKMLHMHIIQKLGTCSIVFQISPMCPVQCAVAENSIDSIVSTYPRVYKYTQTGFAGVQRKSKAHAGRKSSRASETVPHEVHQVENNGASDYHTCMLLDRETCDSCQCQNAIRNVSLDC